jgi:hypothetical protein
MTDDKRHTYDAATSNVLAWSAHAANMSVTEEELSEDADEPPETRLSISPAREPFCRTAVHRKLDTHASLLTKALQNHSDDDTAESRPSLAECGRRRSMTSNVSLASTADLTSDTGLTSPSRTNTPSPPLPEMRMLRLGMAHLDTQKRTPVGSLATRGQPADMTPKAAQPQQQDPPKKRCISFACTNKPNALVVAPPMVKVPSAQDAPKRPCIKFACPIPRPASTQNTPPSRWLEAVAVASSRPEPNALDAGGSPSTIRTHRSPAPSRSPRPAILRRLSEIRTVAPRKKFFTANSTELTDCARFHEFASDERHEDDWIRQEVSTSRKITINDTLTKENAIRKLATEAEEEAEQEEEEEEEAALDDEEEDVDDNGDGQDSNDDDEDDVSGSDDGSDGYSTDEETGFADSDEENDEDEDFHLWNPGPPTLRISSQAPTVQRPSTEEPQSDSSIPSRGSIRAVRRSKSQRIKIRPGTPELPDSTDFVCGTLDEDRPIEDAYISCLAARRREKTLLIPQDIDPSFPASDPENEEDEELFNPVHHSSDEDVWVHGKMEDLDHEQDRSRRKKRGENSSPKRYHSPPPKRLHSPPPRARGRSPRRLFDRQSPRKLRSPPRSQALRSPPASPRNGTGALTFRDLGSRPGLTQTKSLPKPPAMFPHMKNGRRGKLAQNSDQHVREAIDIFKGLQQKRQRRKEKFYQMYCNRARKGQIPERPKQKPGQGAERMRELGLLMAGKIDHGNYVLSV